MKHLKVVILIVMAVWFFVSLTTISYAEQPAIAPKQIQKSVPVATTQAPATSTQTIKPLQQPLLLQGSMPPLICPSLVATINDVIKIAQTDMQAYVYGGGLIEFLGTYESTAGKYRNHVQDCCSPNKSFSVQDQKNAGCAGNDTVNICMDKAIKHCIHLYKYRISEKDMLSSSIQKADKLSNDAKKLHDNVKKLNDMMP